MEIIKKNVDQLTSELEKALIGRKQGDVITLPIGKNLFPMRFTPQIEIVLLDTEEFVIAYRGRSHPNSPHDRKGAWMIGKPAAVAGEALQWVEKMIAQKEKENDAEIEKNKSGTPEKRPGREKSA